jgi:MarR family transcriptional regulator, lower aerobic nicotinate degradation pathway regulator
MNYQLTKDVIDLLQEFEGYALRYQYEDSIEGFIQWVAGKVSDTKKDPSQPDWEGKEDGRTPESVISTMLVRLGRYGKMYSRHVIAGSAFSTQEDFIYLINLKAMGAMTKMELIRKNIQDKPTGMQVIGRLISHGWVQQSNSQTDRRSKVITITAQGVQALEAQMQKIRQATNIVSGNLTYPEKMDLIRLLKKLDDLHEPIFNSTIAGDEPLTQIARTYLITEN